MITPLFFLPVADSKWLEALDAPPPPKAEVPQDPTPALVGLGLLLLVTFLILRVMAARRGRLDGTQQHGTARRPTRLGKTKNVIVVDGSNVMHWLDDTPRIESVQAVVDELVSRGYDPGVVFDANAGYKLFDKFVGEKEFGRLLGLPADQILVVPKDNPADPFIIETAQDFNTRIVTNDYYRDWAEQYPWTQKMGYLIRGEMIGARVHLRGLDLVKPAVS